MRPVLENVSLASRQSSLLVFERNDKRFEPYWHYHPEVELTLITGGRGMRFIGDHIGPYFAGDLVLVGRELPHQWLSSEQSNFTENSAVVIQFREDLFHQYPECEPIKRLLELAKRGLSFSDINPDIKQKVEDMPHLDAGRQLNALMSLLFDLAGADQDMLSSVAIFDRRKGDHHEKKINGIINLILDNRSKPLSVTEVAERANLVPQSFCRWFKQQTGQSYIKFLNKIRLELACELLLTTDLPVHDIAFKSGFDNVSHFNRTFKNYQGLPPTGYRQGRELQQLAVY